MLSTSTRRGLLPLIIIAGSALAAGPARAEGRTLANLQQAFDGESNARARYLAFAKKADSDGFAPAASLFRAAARAEEIHAAAHASVIKSLGAVPKANLKAPEVKATKDNLAAALKGETYERDTMYPTFIKQARQERNKDAMRAFNFAIAAEAEHAKLYTAALSSLTRSKAPTTHYVCTVCGYTTLKLDFKKCPSCYQPVHKYVEVR